MPSDIELSRFHGLDAVELHAPDGARATVLLHGGHVVSWIPAGANEQLYLSPKSGFAPGQAIRGGVPVIFPQFNARGPLQRHGFARNMLWQLVSAKQEAGDALAVLRLADDDATLAIWPHRFNLELRVSVRAGTLTLALSCENRGDSAFTFTGALHTYRRVGSLAATRLQGLAGMQYWDSVADTNQPQEDEWLAPAGDLDRVYYKVDRDLLLTEPSNSGERRLQIHQQGFGDAVVWNPGAEKCAALADMPPDGYLNMLCVEAAAIAEPINLASGERWTGVQKLDLL
jgi:glucose-6-phosphate 1-epimerase